MIITKSALNAPRWLSIISYPARPRRIIVKSTWTSPDGRYMYQIDHIAISIAKFRRSITDTRTYRGADIGSDHNLVIANIKLKLCRVARSMMSAN